MSCSEQTSEYIGRFAPSPTGLLHLGSLVAAIASYCDAMKNNGKWLIRIEDIDPPREITGASKGILSSLQSYGFQFPKDVLYQSTRNPAYNTVLNRLKKLNATYECKCSRSTLKNISMKKHICRDITQRYEPPFHIKCKVPNIEIDFEDQIQGQKKYYLHKCGDFVLQRSDGYFAYQLAVVSDDHFQGITHIVRGIDLLDSTPWQIYLNSLLGFNQPHYAHIPILTNDSGQKLSKQTFAKEIDNQNPLQTLMTAYNFLNQSPFSAVPKTIDQFWHHAIENWELNKIAKVHSIKI